MEANPHLPGEHHFLVRCPACGNMQEPLALVRGEGVTEFCNRCDGMFVAKVNTTFTSPPMAGKG
jgi:hypothetical protein